MRRSLTLVTALVAALLMPTQTAAAQTLAPNPWLERRILNIAHQGGEIEAPSNTLFAFKTAVAKGADVLELDIHASADRELVVIHDATVDRTTGGTGSVDELTLDQIKSLDAAYWFVPDCGTCHDEPESAYAFRGIATGERKPNKDKHTKKFEPNDFTIPTLDEVLEAFPEQFINIEIKATAPDTMPYERELAALLAEHGRSDDTIVVAFNDVAVESFKAAAPDVHTATGTGQAAAYWASAQGPLPGLPNPRYQALQVPIELEGVTVVTPEFVQRAHSNGLAVHVWTIDARDEMEWLIDIGVDGIMTNRPTLLEQVLIERQVLWNPT